MTKYWCVNFDSEDCLRHGIEKNLWMMQYQYADDHDNGFQSHKSGAIRNNWQQLKKVSPGDWFVAYLKKNRYFAVGRVRKPRLNGSVSDATPTIDTYLDAQRSHDHENSIVFFTDAPVLYEDFTDKWSHPGDMLSRYAQRIDVEEWQHVVSEGAEMKGLRKYILKKPHLAVTKIDRSFFRRIEKQLKKSSQVDKATQDAVVQALEMSHSKGQGFQTDSKLRKALEVYAMDEAKLHFTSDGYEVEDHSKSHSYDLLCSKKNERLYVEVKGTQTSGEVVFLTYNEVEFARLNKGQMALFLLHSIKVSANKKILTNGQSHVILSWDVDEGCLKPVSYHYEVPGR